MRVGIGYDIHVLKKGIPLVLGGVKLPSAKGPAGHSDGDALIHAIVDALLGAMAAGDIGDHFSDKDPKWKGADSRLFLRAVRKMLKQKRYRIASIDSVVIIEAPKLAPHKLAMREAIAKDLGVEVSVVSVKAKTHEKVGAIGRGKAVACYAVASIGK